MDVVSYLSQSLQMRAEHPEISPREQDKYTSVYAQMKKIQDEFEQVPGSDVREKIPDIDAKLAHYHELRNELKQRWLVKPAHECYKELVRFATISARHNLVIADFGSGPEPLLAKAFANSPNIVVCSTFINE